MNRVTVILLALVVLLAHGLAIHQTNDGELAPPYEHAHAAYRMARNYVHDGVALWDTNGPVVESYPSPVWVGVSAFAERFSWPPTRFTQGLGIFCALITIAVLAQFSPKRKLGLAAPLLLAASGSAAAAALSGTEAALMMLLVTAAFLGFERGWRKRLTFVLCLLVATRSEGVAILAALFVLEFVNRPEGVQRRFAPYLIGALLACGLALLRFLWTGSWLSPTALGFWPEREDIALGYEYIRSFFLQSGSGPLIALPLIGVFIGGVTATARRAFALVLLWCSTVLVQGGDGLPMWNGMAPILPLFFLSVQGTIRGAIDRRPTLSMPSVAILVVAIACSFLVSMTPGDIGPFRLMESHRRWLQPSNGLKMSYGRELGRSGLIAEIKETALLRSVGVFLRDKVRSPTRILTPWPGAVGYLSRQPVEDLLGRATLSPDTDHLSPWSGAQRVDLLAALHTKADYVLPTIEPYSSESAPELLRQLLESHDNVGSDQIRFGEFLRALRHYELISVPVPIHSEDPGSPKTTPFLLLRSKSLNMSPRLTVEVEGDRFRVLTQHRGCQLVVNLRATITDGRGRIWTMRPTGEFVREEAVNARMGLLLYASSRPIRLLDGVVPQHLRGSVLTVRLYNPGPTTESQLSAVGEGYSTKL